MICIVQVSWGGLVMFGSYNKFGHKVHITAATISSLDFLTSIISGLAVFSILGNLAHQQGVAVADVVAGGPGLAFITFPEALAQLPLPQLWAVMFFFMLYLLGLDSEFALIETVLTSFYDFFPKAKRFKSWLVFLLCSSCFLMSLPCVSYSGIKNAPQPNQKLLLSSFRGLCVPNNGRLRRRNVSDVDCHL